MPRRLRLDHSYFDSIDTAEKAYWFGFMLAGGSVSAGKNGGLTVKLAQKEVAVLEGFREAINSDVAISDCGKGISQIQFVSEQMAESLISHGCVRRKSLILKAPVETWHRSLNLDIVRGYNDGDGGIYYISGSTCMRMRGTADFLRWVRSVLPYRSSIYCYSDSDSRSELWTRGKVNGIGNIKALYYPGSYSACDKKSMLAASLD